MCNRMILIQLILLFPQLDRFHELRLPEQEPLNVLLHLRVLRPVAAARRQPRQRVAPRIVRATYVVVLHRRLDPGGHALLVLRRVLADQRYVALAARLRVGEAGGVVVVLAGARAPGVEDRGDVVVGVVQQDVARAALQSHRAIPDKNVINI